MTLQLLRKVDDIQFVSAVCSAAVECKQGFVIDGVFVRFDVSGIDDFLRLVWHVFAEASRGSDARLYLEPHRFFTLPQYSAVVEYWFEFETWGIRYRRVS